MTTDATDNTMLILLVQEGLADAGLVRKALGRLGDGAFRLQCVENLSTAFARIAGGDVDVVLLDLSVSGGPETGELDSFHKLRREAPHAPVIVLCAADDEGVAIKAMRAGAADYVIKERCADNLRGAIRSVSEMRGNRAQPHKTGGIIALLGAKGGAGTTTVALNVASVLAQQRNKVALLEMRPTFGTLSQYFRPTDLTNNLSHLLDKEPAAISQAEVAACLWTCKNVTGLKVLFGPQTASECREIGPAHAAAISKALAGIADYVVVDLPASLSEANRAVIEKSGFLALVVERDPMCVESARRMVRAIASWTVPPQQIDTVIVSRVSLRFPMSLPEIGNELGGPALGVIPSEPDLCQSAQNARTPLVAFLPESQIAGSLVALAERLASGRQWQAGAK
jgi:pilus assembly protein CpaE